MENLEKFHGALVAALVAVTNIRFGKSCLPQVVLPVHLGGLRIRLAEVIAFPAFISPLQTVRELVDGILYNVPLLESNDLSAVE